MTAVRDAPFPPAAFRAHPSTESTPIIRFARKGARMEYPARIWHLRASACGHFVILSCVAFCELKICGGAGIHRPTAAFTLRGVRRQRPWLEEGVDLVE